MKKVFIYGFVIFLLMVTIAIMCMDIDMDRNSFSKEKFLSLNNDPDNDGKMKFNYLTNPNYKNNILARYYIDDDIKINGSRMVQHPYQDRHWGVSQRTLRKFYGDLFWDQQHSDNIYNAYKIRL